MLNILTFSPEYLETESLFKGLLDNISKFEDGKPLDLFPDTQLTIVWENPLMLVDEISVEFSLTFDVPNSPANSLIFNHPERINITCRRLLVPAIIMTNGLIIAKGELIFISLFKNNITLQFKGAIDVIYKNETLRQISMGMYEHFFPPQGEGSGHGMPWYVDFTAEKWNGFHSYMESKSSDAEFVSPFSIGVVRKKDAGWDGHEGARGLMHTFLKYVNYFNPRDKKFCLDDEVNAHTPIFPFLSLSYILQQLFRESGGNLLIDPLLLSENDIDKIVIVGTHHKRYNLDSVYHFIEGMEVPERMWLVNDDGNIGDPESTGHYVRWNYANFMQNIDVIDFLKDILKIFSLVLYRDLKFSIESRNDIFERDVVVSWEDKLHDDPDISVEKAKEYVFNYGGSEDSIEGTIHEYDSWQDVYDAAMEPPEQVGPLGEWVGTQFDEEFLYKVKGFPQVLGITKTLRGIAGGGHPWLTSRVVKSGMSEHQHTIPYIDDTEFTEGDIVLYENFKYLVLETHTSNETTNPPNDSPELYKLIPKKEEAFSVQSSVAPLDMSIERYWWLNQAPGDNPGMNVIPKEHWHVPVIQSQNADSPPHLMLFAGRKPTFHGEGDEYPYLTNHHTDAQGNKIFTFSLLPGVKDGIIDVFHKRMKEWVEKDKLLLKAQFRLSAFDIKKINMRDKIFLHGKKFFIQKITFSLSNKGISKSDVELIEV